MDFRKIPNISVDCVVFGFDQNGINILLSKRQLQMHEDKYPVINDWVLIGDHVFKSEKLDKSAERIFNSYINSKESIYKKQFRSFGNPQRIKNEKDLLWLQSKGVKSRVLSVAYYFLLPTSEVELLNNNTKWFPINNLPQLGFDHEEIISIAFNELKSKVISEPLIFELLEDKFTLNEFQFAYESILDIKLDNRNFRKKAIGKTYIVQTDEKRFGGGSKKPANLYMFSKDIYEKIVKDNHLINI
nr:NUDIX hydrolase [uncultured Carboxylicivirga sp.]